jgi:protein TonB
MEAARRHKRYPRVAQDNNWEGRVELRLAFAENGALAALTVKKGAGRAALDDAALAMLRSAQAQTPVPPALRGKAFVLEIPVDFLLRDAGR